MTVAVTREQALAYRVRAHGLADAPPVPALWTLGVQDSPPGSARLALAARRLPEEDGVVTVWSHRGAPHRHRATDLPALAAALWPRSDADAASKLGWQRSQVMAAGMPPREAVATAATAFHAVMTAPMTRGGASAAVTGRIPEGLSLWCRGCGATHVHEQLFRLAGLPAGVLLEPDPGPLTLVPAPGWPGVPDATADTTALVTAYLRLHGPANPSEVAGFLGTTRTELAPSWPSALVKIDLEGRAASLPADDLDALRGAEPVRGVRLLPPSDPYLQLRDRGLAVPDKAQQKELWKMLGNPGALLVDGEVAGTWRARKTGRSAAVLTVATWVPLRGDTRRWVEQEACRVGEARGTPEVTVRFAV